MRAGVMLGRFSGVVRRVRRMTMRDVSMMAGLFMMAGFVVLGGLAMMMGGVFVMLGGSVVMLGGLLRVHA